ncbi:MAG: amidase domain-containing protein [Oscillospiraceae bacterium]|jgi:hypothetical protein|nr:amidase domain-containing protein [Oscillospiraceae bacterium]
MPTYDRAAAVAYAHRYALAPNGAYYSFEKLGGDCTSFVSQCLYAGFPEMNYSRAGWYYNSVSSRSPSWSGVEFLRDFLVSGGARPGPAARESEPQDVAAGDIVQLSFDGGAFSHSLFVVEVTRTDILVATHSYNADYRPLGSYEYRRARALRVL